MAHRDSQQYYLQAAEEIKQRVASDMQRMADDSKYSVEQKVALACRILAEHGHSLTLAGQITARENDEETYWTTSFATGFAVATTADILRVDSNMEVTLGSGIANPGVRFHAWVYRARPEIRCIVHTHPPYAAALSMTGEALTPSHMDSMMFYDDCAFLPEWPGVPLANEEGEMISRALGTRRSILLAHHGILTVGASVDEAVYLAVLLERAAQIQILARSMGTIKAPEESLARAAHDFLLQEPIIRATFDYWVRLAMGRSAISF